jgi:hypothetical protein
MEGHPNNHACLFLGTLFQRLGLEYRAVFEQEVKRAEFKLDKRSIGCELKKGEQIEGAQLKAGDFRLVIE